MTKRFVLVAGNIGAGKTSLTRRLSEQLDWQPGFESVSDNPYLADFYQDMAQWSFHLQVFFLGHRAEQHAELANNPKSTISDRSIYEDRYIFARALRELGNIKERDFQAYRTVYEQVVSGLPRPHLLLYLKAPIPVLVDRIRKRGREMEEGLSADYLALLDRYYDEWLQEFDICPVLTINSESLNFVDNPDHLNIVIQHMNDKLAGKETLTFPAND